MSHHPQTSTDGPHGVQEHAHADGMNLSKIIMVGVVALAVFAAGVIWAYFIYTGAKAEINKNGAAKQGSEIGKTEIGIVDQVLFSDDHRLEDWKAAHRKHLDGVGWVDKAKGIVHIPIEQAMQKVVASPPDIAGEGVAPAAAPVKLPPEPAQAVEAGKRGDKNQGDKNQGDKNPGDKNQGDKKAGLKK
jgi:hypothetical protein